LNAKLPDSQLVLQTINIKTCREEETSFHLLGKCCATMLIQHHILAAYTPQLKEPCRISPSNWLVVAVCQSLTKVKVILVTSRMCTRPI